MSRIFFSHSSSNNAEAVALYDWLKLEGWDDIFLDVSPERGIAAGERWERALNRAASRCEAVLFLISRAWLASRWCLKEFNLARKLNKRLFGVLVEEIPIAELPPDLTGAWQVVDLASGQDHLLLRVTLPRTQEESHVTFSKEGLARLRKGLAKAGLDPRFFAWPPEDDPNRPPYRGLKSLEAADAGIFFGRDGSIVEALDTMRGLREAASPRLLVILGASGAGKSSFLRAGLWPRLARDDRNFLPLPVVRPERAAISGEAGLLHAIDLAFAANALRQSRADIRQAIKSGSEKLRPLLAQLASKAFAATLVDDSAAGPPTIVLAIDQAEELFLSEAAEEGQSLLALVRDLVKEDHPPVIAIFAIRSDSYDRLETAKIFEGMRQQTLPLLPMPRGAYQTVIEGPAARLNDTERPLNIEPRLTQRLLEDIDTGGGSDALPLLAFTLEQLYLDYGSGGALKYVDYESFGGLRGAIEAAVERAFKAADADPSIPRDRERRLTLLRRGLIPWLAGIDLDTGSPRRRVARISEIPVETRPLIKQLVEQRLLATDIARDSREVTIEPAHEALLRQWSLLRGWLDADFGALTTLDGVKRAARDWVGNNRNAAWLTHTGARLQEAERLRARSDLASHIEPAEQDYLTACLKQEDAARRTEELRIARERRNLRRVRWALMAFFVAVMAALGGALWQSYETSRREAAVFASEAESAFHSGLCDRALRMAEAGLPPAKGASPLAYRSVELENDLSEFASSSQCPFRLAFAGHKAAVLRTAFSPDGGRVITASADGTGRVWDAASGSTIATLSGHQGPVNTATFSPDGSRILTASDENTARLWDAASGAALAIFSGHVAPVNFAAFSPDGHHVVTASDDKTARVWDADTGRVLFTLEGHKRRTRTAMFSPDGARIVTASNDNTARLWDARTGAAVATLSGHTDWVRTAAFSLDGSRIVTASEDKTARLWNGVTGAALATLSGHAGYVVSAAFSPDGNRVVTASFDKTARLWDGKTGDTLAILSGHDGRLNSAVFAQDGQHVITASEDKTARIWDSATGVSLARLAGHGDKVWSAAFNPDGSRAVTGSADTTARLWDCTNVLITALSGHRNTVRTAVFSPDGNGIVTASYDGTARLWDGRTGDAIMTLVGHQYRLRGAVFSPDSARVVTVSFDNTARLWNAKTGDQIAVLTHGNWVRSAAFSPDGNHIVTVSDDKIVRLWDGKTGAKVAELVGHNDRVGDATFSPDGKILATAAYDDARLWDVKTGAGLATLVGHTGRVNNISFSPDGSRVVTSSEDKTARLWDEKTGAPLATMIGHEDAVYSATFSPDGSRVLTASFDSTARLWDGKTGAALMTLSGHGGPVNSAAFSPGGGRIVTASFDNTARVWNAATGKTLVILSGHSGPVNTAVFSSDGERIVTASEDGTARIWNAVTARKWELDPINQIPSSDRQEYVCRERLIGVQAFTDFRNAGSSASKSHRLAKSVRAHRRAHGRILFQRVPFEISFAFSQSMQRLEYTRVLPDCQMLPRFL